MIIGPDSAAQIPIQAAEYLRRYGAFVPFEICPPLLPLLVAALSVVGIPETAGYIVIVIAAYLGGCAAVWALVRRYQPESVAIFAAVLYALAPTRLPPASFEHGSLLLSWSLAPLLLIALDDVRQKAGPGSITATIVIAGLMWAANPSGLRERELVAMAELVLVVGSCLFQEAVPRRVVFAGFVGVAGWMLLLAPSRHQAPAGLAARFRAELQGREIVGAVSLPVEMNPIRSSAREVVTGPGELEASLLWLRAMAAGFLLSDDHQKYSGALDCVEEQAGWCLYTVPNPNSAPAVLVSRHQWEDLRRIRGLYDIEGLSQYVAWAGRPEAASFELLGGAIEVRADLGPLDMFLIRRNCAPGWKAYVAGKESGEIAVECDPLGFMVVDPRREGETIVRLEFSPPWPQRLHPDASSSRPLPGGQFPRITPGGVIEAAEFRPPPFEPGALLSVFGHNFVPDSTRVLFGDEAGDVVWVGPQQINVRLSEDVGPGELDVVVESAGRSSFPETIVVGQSSRR